MIIKRFSQFNMIKENISLVFLEKSKKDSKYLLDRILKARTLEELEDVDLSFDEVILPYGNKPDAEILADIKMKAQEHYDSIPTNYRPMTPIEFQKRKEMMSKQQVNSDAYKDWD